jgi:hypothetical protein
MATVSAHYRDEGRINEIDLDEYERTRKRALEALEQSA